MGPFHGVQSFRNRLLQRGSPWSAGPARKPTPVWAPLHGPQLLPGACSSMCSPQTAASIKACPSAPVWGPPQAAVWLSAPLWSSMGCRETTCVTMFFSMGCRGISALTPRAPPPPPSPLTLVSSGLFLSHFSHSLSHLLCRIFYTFLKVLLQRHHQCHCWAQLCPKMGWLDLVGTICVLHSAALASHQDHPSSPPWQCLGMDTQYRNKKSKGNKLWYIEGFF